MDYELTEKKFAKQKWICCALDVTDVTLGYANDLADFNYLT